MQTFMPFHRLFFFFFLVWTPRLETTPVLSASQKQIKKKLFFSDVGELNKPLRSGKIQVRPERARVLNIPFQSAAAVCLTLIKHNHKAMGVCVSVLTHTQIYPHPSVFAELTTPGS